MLELARETDWEAIKRLSVQIHQLHTAWRPDIFLSCEEPYPRDQFLQDIRGRLVYTAKIDNCVIGYVVLSMYEKSGAGFAEKKVMRLDSICVEELLRGQGIGKAMVADVRALAYAFGCKELVLGVHAENDMAVGFYQKCGFRIRSINMDMKI